MIVAFTNIEYLTNPNKLLVGLTCESNIDECLSNPCDNNATCIDGIDEYICNCEAGFEGNFFKYCMFHIFRGN